MVGLLVHCMVELLLGALHGRVANHYMVELIVHYMVGLLVTTW